MRIRVAYAQQLLTTSTALGLSAILANFGYTAQQIATWLTGGGNQLANSLDMAAEVASVRWRDDGTAPTSAIGMLLSASTSASLVASLVPYTYIGQLLKIQWIAANPGAILNLTLYRGGQGP